MRNRVYLWLYVLLCALYAALSLRLPSDPKVLQKYNVTQGHAHLVSLGVVVPLVLVWAAALYGFLRFKAYSKTIEDTAEGRAFNRLSSGLMIMAFSLPILGCVSSLSGYYGYHNPDMLPTLVIIKNYLNLIFPLMAFLQIVKGAEQLTHTLKRRLILPKSNWALLGAIIMTSIYVWLITTRTYGPTGDVAYFLPNWLIISTLAIPYLYIWCRAIAAAYYINAYQSKIRGTVYKQSLKYLAQGIVFIIGLSISIQLISTLSVRLTRLQLTPLLALVYVLVGLYAVGYGLVARGAKKLKLIEEV